MILKQKWDVRSAKKREAEYMEVIEQDMKGAWDMMNTAVVAARQNHV